MVWKMESLRLRLEFKNPDILSDAQKSQQLDKSWMLLPHPQSHSPTLAALSAYIVQHFHLNQSCPHGLRLSMDGFALPSFLSISILKDNDVISVEKIDHLTVDGSDTFGKVGQQLMALDCVSTGTLLLSNDKFDKESGGFEIEALDNEYAEEHEEINLEANDPLADGNDISKRKTPSQKLEGSKKKKQRSELREAAATGIQRETKFVEIPHKNEVPLGKKSKSKKGKSSKTGNRTTGDANARHDEETIEVVSASSLKINEQFQVNAEDDDATNVSNIEIDQLQNEVLDQPKGLLHWKRFGGKDISEAWTQPEEENQNNKTHGNLCCNELGRENQNHETHANSNIESDTANVSVPIEIIEGHILSKALEEDIGVHEHKSQIFKPKYVPRECYDFIQGKCNWGASCRFLHSVPDKAGVGTETNETHSKQCNNIRRDRAVRRECYDFTRGKCNRGDSCRFLHSLPDLTDLGVEGTEAYGKQGNNIRRDRAVPRECIGFIRGKCIFGATCRFLHSVPNKTDLGVKGTEAYGKQANNIRRDVVPQECIGFIRGKCNRGTSCCNLHSVPDKTDRPSSFHNRYYQDVTSSSKVSNDCLKDQSSSFNEHGRCKAVPEVCRHYTQGKCNKESLCRYLHKELSVTVGLGSTTSQAGDMSRFKAMPEVCRYYTRDRCHNGSDCRYLHLGLDLTGSGSTSQVVDTKRYISLPLPEVCRNYSLGRCHKGSDCRFLHPEPGMSVGSGPASQLGETSRFESLLEVCRSYSQVSMQENNNIDLSASKAIPEHANGGPCNGNNVTSMSFGSTEKCTDSIANGNVGPNQSHSAQAPTTPENRVDVWEQAFSSKKEVSKESSWGKITTSNNVSRSMSTSTNKNNNRSRGASNGSTVRPIMSYRGRGRQYGRN